jgi:VWFA-related protein
MDTARMFLISRRNLLAALACIIPTRRLMLGQQPTFTAEVKVVSLLATVRNKKGEIIRNLTKEDFQLEEDGRPQTIQYFSQESDLPLTLGLLVDTSMSQIRVLGAEQSATYRFLEQVLREDKDQAFLIHFDREVELLQDITSSRSKLEAALRQLEAPQPQAQQRGGGGYPGPTGGRRGGGGSGRGRGGAGTLLYDAVLLASDDMMKKETGRKAVILLTDGVDQGSQTTLSDAIRSAQRADTLAYSILFADEQGFTGFGGFPGMGRGGRGGRGGGYPMPAPSRPDGKKVLQQLSRETGGAFYQVSKKQPIETVFSLIDEELRHQYSLGYTPDKTDRAPGYRKIRLTARNQDLIVQTRDGYFAER